MRITPLFRDPHLHLYKALCVSKDATINESYNGDIECGLSSALFREAKSYLEEVRSEIRVAI